MTKGIRNIIIAAGLLVAFAFFSAAARASLSAAPQAGSREAPHRGQVRIPVIIIDNALSPDAEEAMMSFFNNELDRHTFRNYWYVNSMGKYDVRSLVVKRSASAFSGDDLDESGAPDWYSYFSIITEEMKADGTLRPEMFDSTGPGLIPDGWMDGAIVFSKNFIGASPILPTGVKSGEEGEVRPGPFVAAGPDASVSDILRAFAGLLGFRGDICLSVLSPTDNGFPMVDAYNRAVAGWADVMDVDGPAQHVLIMPALTTGKVYRVGGDKEYFLIENRAPGEGYDLSLESPGLAIYHIIESAPIIGMSPGDMKWYSRVVNESPDASYSMQTKGQCTPDSYLFRDGDKFAPDYENQNSPGMKNHPLNSNWYSGEPSDILILNLDTKSHYPIITAVFGSW